jgi:hypothetical protein
MVPNWENASLTCWLSASKDRLPMKSVLLGVLSLSPYLLARCVTFDLRSPVLALSLLVVKSTFIGRPSSRAPFLAA